jgi:hypothetical protein
MLMIIMGTMVLMTIIMVKDDNDDAADNDNHVDYCNDNSSQL